MSHDYNEAEGSPTLDNAHEADPLPHLPSLVYRPTEVDPFDSMRPPILKSAIPPGWHYNPGACEEGPV